MGVYFLTYEYIVQQVMRSQKVEHRSQLSPTTPLLAGASAGVVLWLMVYPIDVVKSYMQTDALVPAERQFHGMFDVVRKVNAASGPKAFFRGIAPTLLRVRLPYSHRLPLPTAQPLSHSNWLCTSFPISSLFRQTKQSLGPILPDAVHIRRPIHCWAQFLARNWVSRSTYRPCASTSDWEASGESAVKAA